LDLSQFKNKLSRNNQLLFCGSGCKKHDSALRVDIERWWKTGICIFL